MAPHVAKPVTRRRSCCARMGMAITQGYARTTMYGNNQVGYGWHSICNSRL